MFQPEFRDDLRFWVQTDRRTALRLLELVEAIVREPFSGIGKPEPLKHLGPNLWSRRLTQEHRLVYLVRDDRIDFLQGRYHYSADDSVCCQPASVRDVRGVGVLLSAVAPRRDGSWRTAFRTRATRARPV